MSEPENVTGMYEFAKKKIRNVEMNLLREVKVV